MAPRTIGEAAAIAADKGIELYTSPSVDGWVCKLEDGSMWQWPAIDDGWRHRQPYTGPSSDLREVGIYNAAGTGWPPLTSSAVS